MIKMEDEISGGQGDRPVQGNDNVDFRFSNTSTFLTKIAVYTNPSYQSDQVNGSANNKIVPMKSVGAVKLLPPDIDEDAGVKGTTEYKKPTPDVEKGKTPAANGEAKSSSADGENGDPKKKKLFSCFPEKKEEEKKPTVGWMELVIF